MLEDLMPNNSFVEVVELIKEEQEKESIRIQTQVTGSQYHADNLLDRAKKAKEKEERSLKKAAKLAEAEKVVEIVLGPDQTQHIADEEVAIESNQHGSNNGEESLANHEWLVE